ncbi:MAG: DUF1987 domain-containing protein [Chlorobi bacterium]|nr:DUF1987 domain-containing protein [Chlorobiota bacterium]
MIIKAEKDTPEIILSKVDCKFSISGKSYSVLIDDVYNKIIDWIEENVPDIKCKMNFEFQFEMISSASLKGIIRIIETLNRFYKENEKISITWISPGEDADIIEIGEDLKDISLVPFNMIQRF